MSASVSCTVNNGIAELWLAREPLNVLDLAMMGEMLGEIGKLRQQPALRAVVVRSRQKAFSAGVDVGEHRGATARTLLATFHRLMASVESLPCPTVALIEGAALGGGLELGLACDLRVVAREARLGLPEIALGVYPPYAALRLPELIGQGRGARLLMLGEPIDGETAGIWGIADAVAPRAEIAAALEHTVAGLRGKSASSLAFAKQALHIGRCGRSEREVRLAALESLYLDRLMATHDADEGLLSFLEKREPKWRHC